MNNNLLKNGSSFLIEIPGKGNSSKKHLYIFCEGVCKKNKAIIVPIQTIRRVTYDNTTVLKADQVDHKFVKKDSYIAYYEAQVIDFDKLKEKIRQGRVMKNISNDIYLKIRRGMLVSTGTDRGVKKCFENMKNKRCCEEKA